MVPPNTVKCPALGGADIVSSQQADSYKGRNWVPEVWSDLAGAHRWLPALYGKDTMTLLRRLASEGSACLLPFSACRRGSVCLRKCHSRRILVPWGGVFDSIPHHPQLSSWQPDWNQIGFNAFHNFVEQICGLREQIKYTFLFGIIKNVTCRLEMDIPSLGIDTVNPKPFLPRIFFLGWFSLRFMGSLIPKSYLRTGMWSSGQDWASASLLEIWMLSLLPCIQFYFPHPFPWALSCFTTSPCSWTNRYGMLESTPVPYPFSELWVEPINIYIIHW